MCKNACDIPLPEQTQPVECIRRHIDVRKRYQVNVDCYQVPRCSNWHSSILFIRFHEISILPLQRGDSSFRGKCWRTPCLPLAVFFRNGVVASIRHIQLPKTYEELVSSSHAFHHIRSSILRLWNFRHFLLQMSLTNKVQDVRTFLKHHIWSSSYYPHGYISPASDK